jgi:hypothetical protein
MSRILGKSPRFFSFCRDSGRSGPVHRLGPDDHQAVRISEVPGEHDEDIALTRC